MNVEQLKTPEINDVDLVIAQFNRRLAEKIEKYLGQTDSDIKLDQKDLEVFAVAESLPEDPLERMMLLEEFRKKPNDRFSDSALTSLEFFGQRAKDVRIKSGKDWRDCLSYPERADKDLNSQIIKKMDEIALLINMPEIEDRFSRMSDFLDLALEKGLLEKSEYGRIKNAIAKEL